MLIAKSFCIYISWREAYAKVLNKRYLCKLSNKCTRKCRRILIAFTKFDYLCTMIAGTGCPK